MTFQVMVADPPWMFGDKLPGETRGAEKNYNVLSVPEICAFPIPALADDAILFLWRVSSMVEEANTVARAWGFTPKTDLVWEKTGPLCKSCKGAGYLMTFARRLDKATHEPIGAGLPGAIREFCLDCNGRGAKPHFGMGRYTRAAHETCIIATRGKAAALVQSHSERSTFEAPVGSHSQKPEKFYGIVERLARGPYVEIFARRHRKGWDCRGDQVNGEARA